MALDLKSYVSPATSVKPNAYTATATGAAVDMAVASGFAAAVVLLSVGTITDGTHTPKLQDSPDNSTWTDVAAGGLQGLFAALATDTDQEVGYVGGQRYVRVVVTVAGATTGGKYAALVVRGNPRRPS